MPTIKSNEIERENTEEQQQSTLNVKVSYLDVVFKVCVDPSDRMSEASVTWTRALFGFYLTAEAEKLFHIAYQVVW